MNHSNNRTNLVRTMRNRVLTYKGNDPIQPTSEALRSLKERVDGLYKVLPATVYPYSYERFLDCYTGHKRIRFQQAVDSLVVEPVKRKDAKVTTFIKNEKFNFLDKGHDADPRAIQPRKPRFLAEVGRWIKPLEAVLYSDLAKRLGSTGPVIAKSLNAETTAEVLRAKWDKFSHPVCVTLDASRFDLHVSIPMLKMTHKIYNYYCKSPRLRQLLSWTLVNTGRAQCSDAAFEYSVKGRRMSGDMDTSLGNCLIMTVLTFDFLSKRGIKFEILNNGDDCLFIVEQHSVPDGESITKYFHDFGFVIRLEGVTSVFERIEFCQTQPVWRGDQWVMVRHPRSIAKDLCNINPSGADYGQWLKGVAICGEILNDGLPIGPDFYSLLSKSGTLSKVHKSLFFANGASFMCKGMRRIKRIVTDETRLSYCKAFGIPPYKQVALEEFYRGQAPLENNETKAYTKWPEKLRERYVSGVEFDL